jgi:poly-gamma-glutamate synthesis protein (capsule biosynthesis protein)
MPQVVAARTAEGGYDYSRSTEYVAPMFRDADVAVVNLETTITTTGKYSGYPCFASPTEVVDELQSMGIDIALLANNHCCDRLSRGIATTIEQLNMRDIAHAGVFTDSADYARNNILRFESRGVRFALVNYTYGTNGIPVPKDRIVNLIDTTAIVRDLRTIDRDSVDCVIACMHWGNEYERRENS